jgi:hypothetical protein
MLFQYKGGLKFAEGLQEKLSVERRQSYNHFVKLLSFSVKTWWWYAEWKNQNLSLCGDIPDCHRWEIGMSVTY